MSERFVAYQMENTESSRTLDRRYYENFRFEKNIHGHPELIYGIAGEVEVNIDGNGMTLPAGKFCLVLPWQVHSFETPSFSQAVVIVFSPRYALSFLRDMAGYSGKTQVFEADAEVQSLFLRYMYEGDFPDEYMISAVFLGLCHCFFQQCPVMPRYQNQKASRLYDVMYYISTHCADKLTLKSVADTMGYSYYHLSHLFRESVGMSFSCFLNMIRVEQAMNRLRDTNDSMTDIAFECGFASVRNFNRVFSELMEMTPSEYRNRRFGEMHGEKISLDTANQAVENAAGNINMGFTI